MATKSVEINMYELEEAIVDAVSHKNHSAREIMGNLRSNGMGCSYQELGVALKDLINNNKKLAATFSFDEDGECEEMLFYNL